MDNISADIALKATALRAKYAPVVRHPTPEFVHRALSEAEKYEGLRLTYWKSADVEYLVVFRDDRAPTNNEVLPWVRVMFDKPGDGQVHEWSYRNYRYFFEGNVYTTDTVADMIGNAFADAADKDSNADAFDIDKTELGKRWAKNSQS